MKDGVTQMVVVQAAIDVFTERGFEQATVADLLQRAGIARRTFYKYFRSKADVLAALYTHVTHELIVDLVDGPADADDPLAGLRAALDRYLEFHVQNDAIVRILLEEATRSESPLWPLRNRFRATLVSMIDRAVTAASGHRVDPLVFLAVISGLEGLSLELLAEGPPSRERVARTKAAMTGLLDAVTRAADTLPVRP